MNVSSPPSHGSSVVITCATADVELIAKVGERLRERGYGVELLGGAETDESALSEAVERVGRQGLYVLVRSAELGRAAVDALRARLRKSDVSFGRILTLTLDGVSSPSVLEDRILSVLQRLSSWSKAIAPVSEPEASPAVEAPPEPVPAKPAVSVSPKSEEDGEDLETWAESLAGRLVAEALEAEPSGTTAFDSGARATVEVEPEPEPRLDVERLVEDEEDEDDLDDLSDPGESRPAMAASSRTMLRPPVPPPLRPKGMPAPPAATRAAAPARPPEASASSDSTVEPALADTLVADLLGATLPTAEPSSTSPLAFASVPSLIRHDDAPGEGSASTDLKTLLEVVRQREEATKPPVARASSSLAERVAPPTTEGAPPSAARPLVPRETPLETPASPLPSDGDDTVTENDASPSGGVLGAWRGRQAWSSVQSWTATLRGKGEHVLDLFKEAVPESPRTLLEPEWWREHRVVIGSTLAAVFVVGLGLAALGGDDEDERSPAAIASAGAVTPEISAASAVPPSPASVPPPVQAAPAPEVIEVVEPKAEVETARPPSASAEAAAIAAALERRRVRAMDTLLVTADAKAKLTFGEAEQHCDTLNVGGIQRWQVPTIGELISLGQAKIVARGSYWSATPGDAFGDRVMVFHAAKGDTAPVSTQARSPSVVCVRPRG